jgi:epoxyqueuosine reductase
VLTLDLIKQKAYELGFNIAGVIPAQPAPTLDAYFQWVEAGYHAKMGYMARPDRQERRADLNVILPGVRSMILVGMDYRVHSMPDTLLQDPSRGRIASYAWNLDYHDVMTPRLEQFADWLRAQSGAMTHRVYVDTGAILERAHAQQAGMGFIGKNTMLIHPRRGSYFFLGEILTDIEFNDYDQPGAETRCGTCMRCLVACPTDAFPQPYVLDAGRCISYLTIENKDIIDRDLRSLMGNWVYGCDVCQDVCPWQRFTLPTQETAYQPRNVEAAAPPLLDLLALDTVAFKARYAESPILRIKRARLVRNACVAAGNWGDAAAVPQLKTLLQDEASLVRGHAAWALMQIDAQHYGLIHDRLQADPEPMVQDELRALAPH